MTSSTSTTTKRSPRNAKGQLAADPNSKAGKARAQRAAKAAKAASTSSTPSPLKGSRATKAALAAKAQPQAPVQEAPATAVPVKVPALQVQVGERIGHAAKGPFHKVASVDHLPASSRLTFEGGRSIRPRHSTELWVLRVPASEPAPAAPAPTEPAGDQAALQQEYDALMAKGATNGWSGREAARLAKLREQLGIGEAAKAAKAKAAKKGGGPVRDERLAGLAKAAADVATTGGAKALADRPQPGNMRKAEAYLQGLGILDNVAGGLHTTRAMLVKVATGTKKRSELADQPKEALTAFGKHDPANFNGRRGAAILVALHDAHKA